MNNIESEAAQQAESTASDLRSKLAPVGLIGKGLLYASLGFIAITSPSATAIPRTPRSPG